MKETKPRAEEPTESATIEALRKENEKINQQNIWLKQALFKRTSQYAFLSKINKTIVQVKEEESLLNHACRVALEAGKFKMAWIGMFDPARKAITTVSYKGLPVEDLEKLGARALQIHGPQEYVMSTGRCYLSNRIVQDAALDVWKPLAIRHGVQSCMILPIRKGGVTIGSFNLYATEPDFFGEEEIVLLEEIARDISYGFDVIEKQRTLISTTTSLKDTLSELEEIMNSSVDIICTIDEEGKFVKVSAASERILGFKPQELLGRKYIEFVVEEDVESTISGAVSVMSGKPTVAFENRYKRKDGTYVPLMWSGAWHPDEKLMYCVAKDATEKVRAVNQLRKSEAFNLGVLNSLKSHIAVIDASGNIVAANEAWNRFSEENGETSMNRTGVGSNYFDVCIRSAAKGDAIAEEAVRQIKKVFAGESCDLYLEYPCHSDNQKRWFALTAMRFEADEPMLVISHTNISERKKSEVAIHELNENLERKVAERTAELSEANYALEAFSYSVSHDLRAPLRAIAGFSKIISKVHASMLGKEVKELFSFIEDSAKRMNQIVDGLLNLAKAGKSKLNLEEVDLTTYIKDSWDNICVLSPHQAKLILPQMPVVKVDSALIQQALTNLLSNAIKYSAKRANPVIVVGFEATRDTLTVSIEDNGAGFDMKFYDRLFGAFQRLHGTNEFEGTGVGLMLVKQIIERHGGKVWAESIVNEGATFYFTLPLDDELPAYISQTPSAISCN